MIKYVVFDVGNVVVKADESITARILQEYGVSSDRAGQLFANEDYRKFSRGNIGEQQFYDALIRHLQTQLTFEQVIHAHDEHLYGIDNEVVELIKQIPAQNLAFLTDTNLWQTRREKTLIDLEGYSNKVFRSYKIHMLKTDPECFPYVRNLLGVNPQELVLVDDSIEKVVLAQKDGWQTIQFQDAEQLRRDLSKVFQY